MLVVDASVLAAAFRADDVAHGLATEWLRAALAAGTPMSAPAILLGEVSAAIRRSTGDAGLARIVLAELRRVPGLRLVPVSDDVAQRAAEIAADHALRGCDAVYVAVAEMLGAALITLDTEMLTRGAPVAQTRRPDPGSHRRSPPPA